MSKGDLWGHGYSHGCMTSPGGAGRSGHAGCLISAPKGEAVFSQEGALECKLPGGVDRNVGDSPNRLCGDVIGPHGVWANFIGRKSFHGSSAGRVSELRSPPFAPEGAAVCNQ